MPEKAPSLEDMLRNCGERCAELEAENTRLRWENRQLREQLERQ